MPAGKARATYYRRTAPPIFDTLIRQYRPAAPIAWFEHRGLATPLPVHLERHGTRLFVRLFRGEADPSLPSLAAEADGLPPEWPDICLSRGMVAELIDSDRGEP